MTDQNDWPWDQPKNCATLTTRQVMDEDMPILQVSHYEDDHSWAFTCGTTNDEEDALLVALESVVKRDPTLAEIADLEPGWSAVREFVGAEWIRKQDDFEDEEEFEIIETKLSI
jgi:hypothetical protein